MGFDDRSRNGIERSLLTDDWRSNRSATTTTTRSPPDDYDGRPLDDDHDDHRKRT